MTSSIRLPLLALVLLLGPVACADGEATDAERQELAELRATVTDLAEQGRDREARLAELEDVTRRLEAEDPLARLARTDEQLGQLVDELTVLDEELAAAVTEDGARDERIAETEGQLEAVAAELRATVEDVREQARSARSRADGVAGEVDELRTLYATLRDRLDRIQRGG